MVPSQTKPSAVDSDDSDFNFDTYTDDDSKSKPTSKVGSKQKSSSIFDDEFDSAKPTTAQKTDFGSKQTGSKKESLTSDPDRGFKKSGSQASSFESISRKEKIKKFILLVLVVVILVLLGYVLGSTTTDSLQKLELKNLRTDFANEQKLSSSLKSNLSVVSQQNNILEKENADLESRLKKLETDNSDLKSTITQLQLDLSTQKLLTQEATGAVRNAVQAVCCSFSDTQSGSVISWGISRDKIMCGQGNSTVDCKTGVTIYK
jgi:cell division protein FtsL